MEKILKYSVLRYTPDRLSGETINLGILICDEIAHKNVFRYTGNYSRILKFDDELDRKTLKLLLSGIEEDVKAKNELIIQDYIKFYISNFRFDDPIMVDYEDFDMMTDELYKLYFRFDIPKSKRPDKASDQEMISRILRIKGKDFEKNKKIKGMYNEPISYDIVTDDLYIKLFDFDNKDISRLIGPAKMWAWNCNHEKDKKVYIIYRDSSGNANPESFKIIKNIFDDSKGCFCSLDEGLRLLQNEAG